MYQPISFSVLRQALKHSGIPTPTMRELSMYRFPDGTQTAEYALTWTVAQIERYFGRPTYCLRVGDLTDFERDVHQSFAEDVTITAPTDTPIQGMFSLVAHVRVSPRAIQLSIFDDRAD